jgi:hypothetical protein
MHNRIKEIDAEIAKLQAEKERLKAEANRKYQDEDIENFSKTYSGKQLLDKYPLNTEGLWKIEGEDPNCDLGGSHHNPHLGYLEGKLEDVIKAAVKMKGWFTWGGGGYITKVEGKLVTKV